MKYRHEQKYIIDERIRLKLYHRLLPILSRDEFDDGNGYFIRSIYFDDIIDSALHDKVNGKYERAKFRLRTYNNDDSVIYLEKKIKEGQFCRKERTLVSREEADILLSDNNQIEEFCDNKLINELLLLKRTRLMRPMQIVDYTRSAFVCNSGNVRITFDTQLSTPMDISFFETKALRIPALNANETILEIKYDAFLPEYIRQILQMDFGKNQSCSKYILCRMAMQEKTKLKHGGYNFGWNN